VSQGRIAEMTPTLRELSAQFPDAADALALALAAEGRIAEARAARAGPVPIRPDYFFTLFATVRALAVLALGERDEAPALIETLRPLADQIPGSLSCTVAMQPVAATLAALCRLVGREEEARAYAEQAERVAKHWAAV
jgi:hypothetical protein